MIPLKMKVDRKIFKTMYEGFVLPTMEYAAVVLGGAYDCDIAKLESTHVDAMRLVTGATARSNIINVKSEYGGSSRSKPQEIATLVIF